MSIFITQQRFFPLFLLPAAKSSLTYLTATNTNRGLLLSQRWLLDATLVVYVATRIKYATAVILHAFSLVKCLGQLSVGINEYVGPPS